MGESGANDQQPLVAIVIRTKDRAALLERALGDLVAQRFDAWEAVIVNDGGQAQIVDDLIARHEGTLRGRVRVIHHESARGRWVSANAGVLGTSAPLIVLHDDDDTWHPDFLELAVAYLGEHQDRGGVVSRIEIIWEAPQGDDLIEVEREHFQQNLPAPTLAATLLYNRFVPIGFVYRRALHEELGLYEERLPVIGDWNFTLKVLSRGPLDYLGDVPYAYWHQRRGVTGAQGNSVIDARSDHARYDALLRDEALREYIDEHGPGLVLYLTKFIDERLFEIEMGIRGEIREVAADLDPFRLPGRAVTGIRARLGWLRRQ